MTPLQNLPYITSKTKVKAVYLTFLLGCQEYTSMLPSPKAYTEGYAKARKYDQARADNYIKHTTMGDPELDLLMEELTSSLPLEDLHRFIGAGIEQQDEVLRRAPKELRDFFDKINTPPPWLDYKAFEPAIRTFNVNVDLMLVAFVTGVLVEGFSTLIAKSFKITGRVGSTTRRLQQNNRHMMEIFFPEVCKERTMDGSYPRVFASFILE